MSPLSLAIRWFQHHEQLSNDLSVVYELRHEIATAVMFIQVGIQHGWCALMNRYWT